MLCVSFAAGCATTVSWKFSTVSRASASSTLRDFSVPRESAPPVADVVPVHAASVSGPRARMPSRRERGVNDADEAACYRALREADVSFAKVAAARAAGVELPLRLTGDLNGIQIRGTGKNEANGYLDCRLAEALLAWSPILRAAGVTAIEHYSMYRENARVAGTAKRSAHASGLAIDAARFQLADGSTISVVDDWRDRTRGADPCVARPGEARPARLMRQIVCEAAARGLFQTILTPHYNQAHHNHVHLEIAELGRGTWIR